MSDEQLTPETEASTTKDSKKESTKKVSLVVVSKVKELVKAQDMQTAGDLVEALTNMVEAKLVKALERAKLNGRKTVRPEDL